MSHRCPIKSPKYFFRQKKPIQRTYHDIAWQIDRRGKKMLTDVVVLNIAYMLNLPTWCKILPAISLAIKLVQFGYVVCESLIGEETPDEESGDSSSE